MIRCSKPSIGKLEKSFVNSALEKSDVGVGEYIERFEKAWSSYNKKEFGVACNSGTNALYLALKSLGIGVGDEVIVPEYTMVATAFAVIYTGATPIFVDCYDNLIMDEVKAERAVTKRTKAVIVVPIYGRPAKYPVVKVPIIEDMAQAHGIQPQGDIACYSFYGNKILTTGEGGMCITNNGIWANEMRLYANMYFDKERTMLHPKVGHNFRMTNLQAAVGLAQVMRIDEILLKRKKIQDWYDTHIPESVLMPRRDVLWQYDIQVPNNDLMKRKLEKLGVESRYGFKPMSMQPFIEGEYKHLNAYKWSQHILYLPVWTDMQEKDVKQICQYVRASL